VIVAEGTPASRGQLTQHVDAASNGDRWLHDIEFDGYPLIGFRDVKAVTRRTPKCKALRTLPVNRPFSTTNRLCPFRFWTFLASHFPADG